jgi:hypothetical protein
MLEFTKTILAKVSFDQGLFRKELSKALKVLPVNEHSKLKNWVFYTFGATYADSIVEAFNSTMNR